MSALTASTVPLAVRVKSSRYDGMITGWLHGGPKLTKGDPGGYLSASFVVDQRLGWRSDVVQDYSRCYILDKRTGDVVFEGDITHPGRSVSGDGSLLEIQVKGPGATEGVLGDWSNSRIYIDKDVEAWKQTKTSTIGTMVEAGENRGGTEDDALNLAFPNSFHVETNYRSEAGYNRIAESGQFIGYIDYRWDCGVTNGSWILRAIATPPSTVVRTQTATTAGSGLSGQNLTGTDYNLIYLQMLWNSGPSSTGASTDVVWTSYMDVTVRARLYNKDGTWKTTGYGNNVTADVVIADLLGDSGILWDQFDSVNARLDAGAAYGITQLAYPDGVQVPQILDDLMKLEPACTYYCGASNPSNDKYSFAWIERSAVVRYEALLVSDEYSAGAQEVDQYNRAVARWRTPIGNLRVTVTTQTIPEMDAAGRTRTFFQDLSNTMGITENAAQANATVLEQHRYPANTGSVSINREIVDRFTGRRVQPYEIEPGYMMRLVGIDPNPDALNATTPNGSTVCRIITNDYDSTSNAADLDLDGVPLSLFRAIMNTRKNRPPPTRKK